MQQGIACTAHRGASDGGVSTVRSPAEAGSPPPSRAPRAGAADAPLEADTASALGIWLPDCAAAGKTWSATGSAARPGPAASPATGTSVSAGATAAAGASAAAGALDSPGPPDGGGCRGGEFASRTCTCRSPPAAICKFSRDYLALL